MSDQNWCALLPFKANAQSKTRLQLPQSSQLSQHWLTSALGQCQNCPLIEQTWVVTLGDQVQLPGQVLWHRQRRPGLNQGIQEWLEQVQPQRWLVILPDLPHLTGEDIRLLITSCPSRGIALAPDRHESGCNGLAVDQVQPRLCFGIDSFRRFQEQGFTSTVVRTPGLAHDVDTLADWESVAWHQV